MQQEDLTISIDPNTWISAELALERAIWFYLKDPNVSLIDLGFRIHSSQSFRLVPELTVRVHVHQKLYGPAFKDFAVRQPQRVINAEKIGFAVDVVPASYILHNPVNVTDCIFEFQKSMASNYLSNEQPGIGPGRGMTSPQLGMRVITSADGNEAIPGIITGVLGYSMQNYNGQKWMIGPNIHITSELNHQDLCQAPDCDSWWLDQDTLRPVAVHFADSTYYGFALALAMPDISGVQQDQVFTTINQDYFPAQSQENSTINKLELSLVKSTAKKESPASPKNNNEHKKVTSNILNVSHLTRVEKRLRPLNLNLILKKLSAVLDQETNGIVYKFIQLCLLIMFSIMILKLAFYQPGKHHQLQVKLNHLKTDLSIVAAITGVGNKRDYIIGKIITIINRYNPGMAAGLKLMIAAEIYEMSIKYANLDFELICATITHETALTWDPGIVSPANAIGLMQIISTTGCSLAMEQGLEFDKIETLLFDPIININLGCRYLSKLIAAYNLDGGLAAYNGGMKRAETWVRNGRAKGILHEETGKYVPSILKIYEEFRRM